MVKLTVRLGSVCDGASFTGKSGTSAQPTIAKAMNVTMTVKELAFIGICRSETGA
jgi:hypothetical protein